MNNQNEVWYIEFLNKEKNHQPDKKTFDSEDSFNEGITWGKENLENFHIDMLKLKR